MRTMLSAHWFPATFRVEMSTILMASGMTTSVVTSLLTNIFLFPADAGAARSSAMAASGNAVLLISILILIPLSFLTCYPVRPSYLASSELIRYTTVLYFIFALFLRMWRDTAPVAELYTFCRARASPDMPPP